jgi:TolB-like protein
MEQIELGTLTLQPHRQLLAGKAHVHLGKKALDILSVLAEAGGEIVTKDELLEAVWPDLTVEENALQVHVAALRKALGEEAGRLRTIRGIGYQLDTDDRAGTVRSGQSLAEATPVDSPAPHWRKPLPDEGRVTVAVLPFANMSQDEDQDYLADGITEDVITDLSKVSALTVIARNTVFTYRGKNFDIREVAHRLNVSHIVEGSARMIGNRVRVTAQLIDGATGGHIWAERYDRDVEDIFGLQDELAQAIVAALKIELLPSEKQAIEGRGTDSVQAYDCYLRAWNEFRGGISGSERALRFARAAVELDPEFSRAWLLLAIYARNLALLQPDRADEFLVLCNEAFEQGSLIHPGSASAYAAKAAQLYTIRQDWLGADRAYARAKQLVPGIRSFEDTLSSVFLLLVGRAREALAEFEEYSRLDPLFITPLHFMTLTHLQRFAEADERMEQARELGATTADTEFQALTRKLARAEPAEVKKALGDFLAIEGAASPLRGEIMRNFDDPPTVGRVLQSVYEHAHKRDHFLLMELSQWAAYFRHDDLALRSMRCTLIENRPTLPLLIWHPLFARLRNSDGFRQIVRELGLADYWRRSGNWGDFARPAGREDFDFVE